MEKHHLVTSAVTMVPPLTPVDLEADLSGTPRLLPGANAATTDKPSVVPKTRGFINALGAVGISSVLFGSILCFGILSFLLFLWVGEGRGDTPGVNASDLWRFIIIPERLGQTVTILSAILRLTLAMQAVIGTSLIAAILFETYGVPLFHVAEVSVLRSVNNGPLRLTGLLLRSRSFWSSAPLPTLLISILSITGLASQFTSTILFTDLTVSAITGDRQTKPIAFDMDFTTANKFILPDLGETPTFTPFAELSGFANSTTPSALGVSDTGVVERAFLPLDEITRTAIRRYNGKAYIHSSRFACMRPTILDVKLQVDSFNEPFTLYLLSISGNLSLPQTFSDAGMEFAENCTTDACSASVAPFNCTVPIMSLDIDSAIHPTAALQACNPNPVNLVNNGSNSYVSNIEQQSNFTQVWLLFASNTTIDRVRPGGPFEPFQDYPLPNETTADGEFVNWNVDDFTISASFCLQESALRVSDVNMAADRDLMSPNPQWDSVAQVWNTTAVTDMYGVRGPGEGPPLSPAQRGLYVGQEGNPVVTSNFTDLLASSMLFGVTQCGLDIPCNDALLSTSTNNVAFLTPPATVAASFEDTFNRTGRPALAFVNFMSTIFSQTLSHAITQFAVPADTEVVAAVQVLAPQGFRGLASAAMIILVSLATMAITTVLFVRHTRYSRPRDYWSAISQVVSDETRWILDEASEMDDEAVKSLLGRQGTDRMAVSTSFDGKRRVQAMRSSKGVDSSLR